MVGVQDFGLARTEQGLQQILDPRIQRSTREKERESQRQRGRETERERQRDRAGEREREREERARERESFSSQIVIPPLGKLGQLLEPSNNIKT